MKIPKLVCIIGARPQFIKHAPLEIAFKQFFNVITIHTGQHYDKNMSKVFFEQLNISNPNHQLHVGSFSHGAQTGRMLEKIETILIEEKPDGVLVYGDTNSTLAGALAASKLHVPLIHVEAGLRSYNKSMPEEINRVLTDHISDYLFTPTEIASDNLYKEGITSPVFMVGDVMCDAIKLATRQIQKREKPSDYESYYYASIHRPYNTDNFERLEVILKTLERLDKKVKIALHPRTRQILNTHNYHIHSNNIELLEPLSYLDNIYTMNFASAIITDSGGIQKEAYLLQKQCITVRSETEWVETLQGHWNTLVFDLEEVKNVQQLLHIFPDHTKYHPVVYGNGESARKIANILFEHLVK